MSVRITAEPFDPGAELTAFASGAGAASGMGAIVTFSGVVRADGGLRHLVIEHYPGMTEAATARIADEARRRWSLGDVCVIHRHGTLAPGETIMMVATAAPHRADAFAAAEFLMDYLKSRAPFWKKEIGPGGDRWVDAKNSDEAALARW